MTHAKQWKLGLSSCCMSADFGVEDIFKAYSENGIEQALLSKFETGERVPPTETLIRLAEFYDVSIDYILCRTDVPEINR